MRAHTGPCRWCGAVVVAAALFATDRARAQEVPAGGWERNLELAGSLFLGNQPQTVLTTRGGASHTDSTFEFAADLRFTYGESTQDGDSQVSQRLWFGSASLDIWPYAGQSPFVLGTVESSFERRVDLRVSGGVGHKLTFVDSDRAGASFSLAALAERSRLQTRDGAVETETLARLSLRLRLRREFGERAALSYESFFRPEFQNMNQYTATNTASASYRVNEAVSFKLSYLDNFDTEARGRGARSNYDGQLVVGVAAEF